MSSSFDIFVMISQMSYIVMLIHKYLTSTNIEIETETCLLKIEPFIHQNRRLI